MVETAEKTKPTTTETKTTSRGEVPAPATGVTEQLIITRRSDNGEIVTIEKVDSNGQKSALSEDQCRQIAGEDEIDEIGAALESAFEAGIVQALGDDDDVQQDSDADEDPLLERLILLRLLARRTGRVQRLRRDMMRRLALRRLVRRRVLRNRIERNAA